MKFLNEFHGVIDNFSLPRPMSSKEWQTQIGGTDDKDKSNDTMEARIVFVDHGSKSVRLSMRPHVLDFRGPSGLPALGTILEQLTIKASSKKQGVLLSKGDLEAQDASLAMAVSSRVLDKDTEEGAGGKVKGAARLDKKLAAADAKRKREINESVLGVFMHKSAIANLDTAESENDDTVEKGKGKGKKSKLICVSEQHLEKQYRVGETIEVVRVLGYHLVEGFAVGTNIDAIVGSKVRHWSDISVGQVMSASVASVRDFGLVMKISANVQAVCPLLHLSDTGLMLTSVQINKKFKVGQTLKVRVWEADGNAIIVTLKKSIVEDNVDPLLSYDDVVEGKISLGVVSRADIKGLIITFFNCVKGFIPMSILVKQGVADAADSYRVGQVVRCLVLKKTAPKEDKKKGRPKVVLALAVGSCDEAEIKSLLGALTSDGNREISDTSAVSNVVQNDALATANDSTLIKKGGAFVSGVVYKVDGENLSVRLSDGRLGQLHKEQCTDFAANSDAFFAQPSSSVNSKVSHYSVGTKITNALVLSESKKVLTLSLKPLLLAAAQDCKGNDVEAISVPNKVTDLLPGQIVAGYIFKVESYGVMVRFREGLTALVPRPNIADRFVSTPEGLFSVGDSVRCVIQRVDLARERIIATFKSAVVGPSTGPSNYLRALLIEGSLAAHLIADSEGKTLPNWRTFPLGSVVSGTVSSIESYGVVLTAPDQTTMMLARGVHSKSGSIAVGQIVKVLVLDIDFKNRVLDVTMDEDFIESASAMIPDEKKKKKKSATAISTVLSSLAIKGSIMKGRVELVQAEGRYLVVSLSRSAIAFVTLTDYHCPSTNTPSEYTEHQEIHVRVECAATTPEGEEESPHSSAAILSVFKGVQRDQTALVQDDAERSDASLRMEKIGGKTKDPATLTERFLSAVRLGAIMTWRVDNVSITEMQVKPDNFEAMKLDLRAAIHLSGTVNQIDASDDLTATLSKASARVTNPLEIPPEHPFFGVLPGSRLQARIVQVRHSNTKGESEKSSEKGKLIIYLSTDGLINSETSEGASSGKRKRVTVAADAVTSSVPMLQLFGKNSLTMNGAYAACITKLEDTGCIVALSPYITSRLHYIDVSDNEEVVSLFMQKAYVGQRVIVQINSFTYDANDKTKIKGVNLGRARIEEHINSDNKSLLDVRSKAVTVCKSSTAGIPTVGSVVFGVLNLKCLQSRIARPPAVQVTLGSGRIGRLCLTELADPTDWKDCAYLMAAPSSSSKAILQLPSGQKHGDLLQYRVMSVPSGVKGASIELSLRPSRLACKSSKTSVQPDQIPAEGSVIQAYVANCTSKGKGCFLRITSTLTGQVLMKDLSDGFVAEPEITFPMGKLVTARLLSVSHTDNTAKLSMKNSIVVGDKQAEEDIKKIEVKSIIEGTVQRVTPIGVFIAITGTSLVGLSRRSVACEDNEELSEIYEVGAFVRAKVLSVAKNSKKVALGLKPSFFVKEDVHGKDAISDSDSDSDEEDDVAGANDDEDDDDDDDDEGIMMLDEEDDGSDAEMDAMIKAASVQPIESDEEEDLPQTKKQKKQKKSSKKAALVTEEEESDDDEEDVGPSIFARPKALKAGKGSEMQWSDFKPNESATAQATPMHIEESDDDSGEEIEEEKGGKGRTRQKEALKRREEQAVRTREAALQDGTHIPERPEDFERLLLAEPSSSLLWVQYMSHYLLQADLNATRQIAERALRTIGFKEEGEKLNVWIAFINMEYKYGDMVSLEGIFKRAVAESNGKLIHLNLAQAYEAANDRKGATAIFEKALKKYKKSKKVWMAYQHFLLKAGDSEGAKASLARSMQSLSRHKHIEVLIKYVKSQLNLHPVALPLEISNSLSNYCNFVVVLVLGMQPANSTRAVKTEAEAFSRNWWAAIQRERIFGTCTSTRK